MVTRATYSLENDFQIETTFVDKDSEKSSSLERMPKILKIACEFEKYDIISRIRYKKIIYLFFDSSRHDDVMISCQ